MRYECAIVGGGIAGLQAAIQLGRYDHRVLVVDSGYGRSTLCRSYHNVLGWPDGISGGELRRLGRQQAEALGVVFVADRIVRAEALEQDWGAGRSVEMAGMGRSGGGSRRLSEQGRASNGSPQFGVHNVNSDLSPESGENSANSNGFSPLGEDGVVGSGFRLYGEKGAAYEGSLLLLATGLLDRFPELPGLVACLGRTIYVCPDCDGFEIKGRRTVVLGSGDCGARMALLLRERTPDVQYINHERTPVAEPLKQSLRQAGIGCRDAEVCEVQTAGDGMLTGVRLSDGEIIPAERGFLAFGGNRVQSELAGQLGVQRHDNGHIWTDARTKMTNRAGVWAAGDVGVHAEQLTIAMGEGSQAAIWMHKAIVQSGRLS